MWAAVTSRYNLHALGPALSVALNVREDVADTDGCDYDLVADDDFVMGEVPGHPRVFVGVGWRGTGYKFSPWVGRTMAELAAGGGTTDDISRFSPARFGVSVDAPFTHHDQEATA